MPDYGIPDDAGGILDWTWARDRLRDADLYWVSTVRPDGRPHTMPTWGVWLMDRFWMEGGLRTRRARNLALAPACTVSVQRGGDVVIVEGIAGRLSSPQASLARRLVEAFSKYEATHGYSVDPENWRVGGLWAVRPAVVFGWSRYPEDATRWVFDGPADVRSA